MSNGQTYDATTPLAPAVGDLFKAYDIRGVVPQELNADIAYRIGRAIVQTLDVDCVVVGRDMRVSGPEFQAALMQGIMDQGANVVNVGMVSTDCLYFAAGKYAFPAGVMITASHNPAEYNGFKICRENAIALSLDTGIDAIRDIVISGRFAEPRGPQGSMEEQEVVEAYAAHVLSMVDTSTLRPMKIAIDAGNGMAGKVAPAVLGKMPLEIVPLYFALDGTFPNHEANPIIPENTAELRKTVVEQGCELGVAFDGDADRMFLIDEHGAFISGDMTTAMVSQSLLKKEPGAAVVYNLICSRSVPELITANGGRPIRSRVGHSFIKRHMREENAIFGGEHSGHFYFRDNFYADSGLIAMMTVLELMGEQGKPLSAILEPIDSRFRSGEINSEVSDQAAVLATLKEKYAAEGAEIDELDGLTVNFPSWWFNIRGSNTQPLLRLNLEADDEATMRGKTDEVIAIVRG